jgi:hypothetical protein
MAQKSKEIIRLINFCNHYNKSLTAKQGKILYFKECANVKMNVKIDIKVKKLPFEELFFILQNHHVQGLAYNFYSARLVFLCRTQSG